ncbi:hypothetical protein OOK60_11935 [Trichothermofontia sichuanensis B231]|uniref:hypothetical protein n=1 Tax=Trichothermofontia sichuanensis TaxID=3045816 RepID=UPI0022464491|nr:hypothetical protein [Trichothermofontia sichuanensis]UZQ53216.1 hypothetical protein OOK60_11935 [Trichothermofontia sichuanensis B231]
MASDLANPCDQEMDIDPPPQVLARSAIARLQRKIQKQGSIILTKMGTPIPTYRYGCLGARWVIGVQLLCEQIR